METNEVIEKHQRKFNRVRLMVKIILVLLVIAILLIQWHNIIHFLKWAVPV
ncbi:MAG TPA: hypothetical protein VMT76_07495 [Puia sp.]|nr:hypothetical protein [Puia sp.]